MRHDRELGNYRSVDNSPGLIAALRCYRPCPTFGNAQDPRASLGPVERPPWVRQRVLALQKQEPRRGQDPDG